MHRILSMTLFWLSLVMSCCSWAENDWQELKEADHRIDKPESVPPKPEKQLVIPDGHYDVGQGQIRGAFGFQFGESIAKHHIYRNLGWLPPKGLPTKPAYTGSLAPFLVQVLQLSPPIKPKALMQQKIQYLAYVDFNLHPISIQTSVFLDADQVIEVIRRKYGEPDHQSKQQMRYQRGDLTLQIDLLSNNRARLRYDSKAAHSAYMDHRNRALTLKYRAKDFDTLTPEETRIVKLAEQLEAYRNDRGKAFGLPFGKRVGFRAKPDEFVPFDAPEPLGAFSNGDYHVMVSPDLLPIALRYELVGSSAEIAKRKLEIELAMELAFAGFIKQTPHHSVLSFGPNAYSLIVRQGVFKFTIHDRAENKKRTAREKLAQMAKAEAEQERLRQLELARQQKVIAERQKQIKEEVAF